MVNTKINHFRRCSIFAFIIFFLFSLTGCDLNPNFLSFFDSSKRKTNSPEGKLNILEEGDLEVNADYDGDEIIDEVIYRPRNSGFYGKLSKKDKILEIHFGLPGDIPVPADYNGDKKTDIGTYRFQSGDWLIRFPNGKNKSVKFGGPGFLPVPDDYDEDGKADLAIWDYKKNELKFKSSKWGNINTKKITKEALENQIEKFLLKRHMKKFLTNSNSYIFLNDSFKLITFKDGVFNFNGGDKLKGYSSGKITPFVGDFDGDFEIDQCIWSEDKNSFVVYSTKNKRILEIKTGSSQDMPFIGYFNDDFICDLGVFKGGIFYINISGNLENSDLSNFKKYAFSKTGNKVIVGDFDKDFTDDFGILNENTGSASLLLSSTEAEKNYSLTPGRKYLVGDFNGDGRSDFGYIDFANYFLVYNTSSSEEKIPLDKKIEGLPVTFDFDLDFKSDIGFFNIESGIVGFTKSSNNYKYDEMKISEKDFKTVNNF